MQISQKDKSHRFAVLLAATLSLSQPLVALASNAYGLGNSNSIIAGISSPNLQDDVLYKPRWSLPSNGVLQKLPLKDDDPDDDPVNTTETKTAEPKAETTNKTTTTKKPAISRAERLNLDQAPQASASSSDAREIKSPTVSKETPKQTKRTAQTEIPQISPSTPLTPATPAPQTPPPVPAVGAPIPGAFIINHAPS